MKSTYNILKIFIGIIALLVLASGIVLTCLGAYHFVKVLSLLVSDKSHFTASLMAIGLLHAVDFFLVAIVFFILALGMVVLFAYPNTNAALMLPEWLRVKNFVELKIILWEAILTTLVVYYSAGLAEKKINGEELTLYSLILPGAVLLIAISLFFLKKGEE